jgi:hypothetical protein
MSSMVELVVAVVGLISACIFLAHAIEAYRDPHRMARLSEQTANMKFSCCNPSGHFRERYFVK